MFFQIQNCYSMLGGWNNFMNQMNYNYRDGLDVLSLVKKPYLATQHHLPMTTHATVCNDDILYRINTYIKIHMLKYVYLYRLIAQYNMIQLLCL